MGNYFLTLPKFEKLLKELGIKGVYTVYFVNGRGHEYFLILNLVPDGDLSHLIKYWSNQKNKITKLQQTNFIQINVNKV